MAGEFSVEEGEKLVKLARKSIEYFLASGKVLAELCTEKQFLEKRGVFVTLHSFPEKELRGCIGFPYPRKSVWSAVVQGAVQAAFNDPRFPRLQASELEKVAIEVSVRTMPEEIKAKGAEKAKHVETGKDGLIVKRKDRSGLLLPQVATEQQWDSETFLSHCCLKAGLPENSWKMAGTDVFKFQAQVFLER